MSAQALIRQAQASGVALRLVDGEVKASGLREAIARLLTPLRAHRAALADALQDEQVETLLCEQNNIELHIDWHMLDAAYLVHHFSCAICIAAGRSSRYGLRCGIGAVLWRAYSKAQLPSPQYSNSIPTKC